MSQSSGNQRKDQLLGEPHGTAAHRLRKMLLFKYVQMAGHDRCYRCQKRIERVEDLSVEHTTAWQASPDPRAVFFDLNAIAFSHLKCNIEAGDKSLFISTHTGKTHCDNGHEFTAANALQRRRNGRDARDCRECNRDRMRDERRRDPDYGRA